MSERNLKAGTTISFGAPAKPMPQARCDAIAQVVSQVPGIAEAHLPQCFIESDSAARQVLVIAVPNSRDIPQIAQALMAKLQTIFAEGEFIDILPFTPGAAMMEGVRRAGCQIFAVEKTADKKPWWKIW
jgi:hypothetical protein